MKIKPQYYAISLTEDADISVQCENLWQSVFTLITSLFQANGTEAYTHCTLILIKHWQTIAGIFSMI